ncbi:MAG: TonB family protein [Betaproteobacteria bacterium]|nr:TonB family protein [Betaproteobacteria bacterium]
MSLLTATQTDVRHTAPPRLSLPAIGLIVAAHIALIVLLASHKVVPLPTAVSALMVDLIQPQQQIPQPELTTPQPRPQESKPTPRRQPAARPQPTLAAQTDAPAATAETPIVSAPPAPPAPAMTTQPRFDADYLSNPPPSYPPLSRRMGEEGKVQLRVFVDAGGRPSQIELKASSGSPRLDQAAQDAVWRWKFVPARRGDESIAAWVLVPIVFTLKN